MGCLIFNKGNVAFSGLAIVVDLDFMTDVQRFRIWALFETSIGIAANIE